jgi:hypothetical protein
MRTNSFISDKSGGLCMGSSVGSKGRDIILDMWEVLNGYRSARINMKRNRRHQRSVARVMNARP